MENCRGLFGEEEKFDSSIFETGIVDFLEAFGIVFNLVRIFIFCNGLFLFFISAKVCILNKVSRYVKKNVVT